MQRDNQESVHGTPGVSGADAPTSSGHGPGGEGVSRADASDPPSVAPVPEAIGHEPGTTLEKAWLKVRGPARSLSDRSIFHRVTLVALLAWVGLGADGLSSSAYGPEEAFRALGEHRALAVALAALMVTTVLVISAGYSRIIRLFPHGGGGYVVASRLIGPKAGVISGCALLVDYVLTITISIAAAGDALFSFLPITWHPFKLPAAVATIVGLTVLNARGVRESVLALTPVFVLFVILHVLLIGGGFLGHIPEMGETATEVVDGFGHASSTLGPVGVVLLILHAFSLGGGTYTGIEAVSNGVPLMRAPQVQTAQRTMIYMAVSLAFTATGLLLLYLLWDVEPVAGKTMNAVLVERITSGLPMAGAIVVLVLASEGALLVVAAQAGFADGPRVLANMAMDSWAPRRFAALSDRLTTQNGVLLMGLAAIAALIYTKGDVRHIVVMYAINVFLTFSISLGAMLLHTWRTRRQAARWRGAAVLFAAGLALCLTILWVTIIDKFSHGGWVTLAVTGGLVVLSIMIHTHYQRVGRAIAGAFAALLPKDADAAGTAGVAGAAPTEGGAIEGAVPNPELPVAAILVGSFGGHGIHTTLGAIRAFPRHFKGLVFLSVGVIDSGGFKGEGSVEQLTASTQRTLDQYVAMARRMGMPADGRMKIGTDAVDGAEALCVEVAKEFPQATFVAGQVVFRNETWLTRLLHNQTAAVLQRRLHLAGLNLLILPARIG